ncbi:DUF6075 family protein [Paenibacillus sp. S-38]|uniref:DUF6075 family protein n=1 Tax=Paenibacillus sp. S-38 TaxID=3416710 RepID=UPI003CF6A8D9
MYQFLNYKHEDRFNDICKRDKTHSNDYERQALFFIIAGNDSLFKNVELLYDFEDKFIKLEALEEEFLTGGTRSLVYLAFSLYGYGTCGVRQLFTHLDDVNSILAIEAMKFRFQIIDQLDYRAS